MERKNWAEEIFKDIGERFSKTAKIANQRSKRFSSSLQFKTKKTTPRQIKETAGNNNKKF